MEPRPPKPPRSTPRQPQPQQPAWDQAGQPASPGQPPAGNRREGGYPGSNRYPDYPNYDQQPGYGSGAAYPQPGQQYPNQQPGYGQQPPDPYAGYQRPVYPPANPQGGYPAAYPGNTPDPYAGYGGQQIYPPQPGGYQPPPAQTGQLPAQAPAGRGSGGWIAPLPDEELSSIQPSPYGGGYGGGGFSGDPRSSRAVPGPNRQTQIVAALAIGGLALMILAIVIGFIVFGGDDDDPSDTPTQAAGITTNITPTTTTGGEQAQTPTAPAGETAVTPTAAPPTETVTQEAPTAAPTQPPADTTETGDQAAASDGSLINGDNGESLLPSADELPEPNFVDNTTEADRRFNRADVAGSLGDQDGSIDDQLRANGFDSNWRREFVLDDASADPSQTSVLFISITIFRTGQGASDSYQMYIDAATDAGYVEVDGESLGEQSTTFELQGEGATSVIYVLQDNVIFRLYGYSLEGDPSADVLALSQTVLAKMP